MRPGRGSSPVDDILFGSFLTFWYVIQYFSFSCSDFEKSGKIDVQKCKISRLSHYGSYFMESPSNLVFGDSKTFCRNWRLKAYYMAMTCSRKGSLRYVCGQSVHPTEIICTFLESPNVQLWLLCVSVPVETLRLHFSRIVL